MPTPKPTTEEARDILSLGELDWTEFQRRIQARTPSQRQRLFDLTCLAPHKPQAAQESYRTCRRIFHHYLVPLL
jgi:hypothetical protein